MCVLPASSSIFLRRDFRPRSPLLRDERRRRHLHDDGGREREREREWNASRASTPEEEENQDAYLRLPNLHS